MAKSLDGIKKLNPEEIKKNRKIVLSYIGEKEPELIKKPGAENLTPAVSNRVDSIGINKKPARPAPADNDSRADKRAEINFAEEKAKREKQEKKDKEESAKKEIIKKAKLEALEKAKSEALIKQREKLALEEKLKEEERIIKENERREKIKRAEEIERIKAEVKSARLKASAKKKIKRQKAARLFKKKLKSRLNEFFSLVKENFVYGSLYLIIFLAIGYAVFCLLVLRFKIDNSITRKIALRLPVPAAVTTQGIIEYNDWRDFDLANKKNSLVGWVVLRNLSRKYGLPANLPAEALAEAFAADESFNQVGLFRVKKIGQFSENADNLDLLSKYADETGKEAYYSYEAAAKKFSPAVLNLKTGQISDIIITGQGYYIVERVADKNGQLGIKYLFVRAKTLDQYIADQSPRIKIFVLAD